MNSASAEMNAFVRVIERGSFAAAAGDLGITPSALSKLVTRIEDRLGVRLLTRTTRRLVLTAEGELFVARSREILASIEAAEAEIMAGSQAPRGHLRISVGTAYAKQTLGPLLPLFLARYPQITVELLVSDRQIDLAGMRVPRLPDQAVGQPAQSDGPIGRSRQQRDARPGSYRLVEGTRMRELPDRDLCMVYTPRAPALYALQDEAWLILRECLGKTRDEVMNSYASLVAAAGVDSDDAALDVLEGLGDLESKGIIEEVPLLPHLDIRRRETLHRRTHV